MQEHAVRSFLPGESGPMRRIVPRVGTESENFPPEEKEESGDGHVESGDEIDDERNSVLPEEYEHG